MSLVADGFVAAGPLSNEAMEGAHLFHEMPKSTAAPTWAHDTSTKQASVAQPTEMPGKKKEKSFLGRFDAAFSFLFSPSSSG